MDGPSAKSSSGPTPRFGASMAVAKSGQLFLFGGMVEDGDKQITLNDFYCLGEQIVQGGPSGQIVGRVALFMAVGLYCSSLLPTQDGGASQISVNSSQLSE